jgi:hypothetical protein
LTRPTVNLRVLPSATKTKVSEEEGEAGEAAGTEQVSSRRAGNEEEDGVEDAGIAAAFLLVASVFAGLSEAADEAAGFFRCWWIGVELSWRWSWSRVERA